MTTLPTTILLALSLSASPAPTQVTSEHTAVQLRADGVALDMNDNGLAEWLHLRLTNRTPPEGACYAKLELFVAEPWAQAQPANSSFERYGVHWTRTHLWAEASQIPCTGLQGRQISMVKHGLLSAVSVSLGEGHYVILARDLDRAVTLRFMESDDGPSVQQYLDQLVGREATEESVRLVLEGEDAIAAATLPVETMP